MYYCRSLLITVKCVDPGTLTVKMEVFEVKQWVLLRFSQQCCWRLDCSGMWHCVVG